MPEPLTTEERSKLVTDHPAWEIEKDAMSRTFTFADFSEAIGFVTRVAIAAEVLDHHPDIDIRWNKVTLTLSTHSAGTLTGLDVELARQTEGFADDGP
ncbi:MAG: 4a-hydroxytetrahydrobiopterin dehydratase [Acidimicrobiia bacterium]